MHTHETKTNKMSDISGTHKIANIWEQHKSINDRRESEIEKKGAADPLTLNHLEKINKAMDRMDEIEAVLSRPKMEGISLKGLSENYEYKKAFCNYIKRGIEADIANLEHKGLSNPSDKDLGYSVTCKMNESIDILLAQNSPMRQISSVMGISSDSLELIEDREDTVSGWSEGSLADIEKAKDTVFTKKAILVHELYAQPKVTQRLIDDPRIDVEEWLSTKLANIFTRQENIAFINGDGNGKPRGILSYPSGTKWGEIERIKTASKELKADDIIKLFFSLKEVYASNTKFLVGRDVLQKIRMLKDNNGQYLWQPNLSEKGASSLFGVEIKVSTDMPNCEPGKLPIAFGNFKCAYQIVDRQNIRVLRDPFTHKPYVKFYTTKRVGGDVVNFEAIKLLEIAS
jgi:HK97 family phage major capsid protein